VDTIVIEMVVMKQKGGSGGGGPMNVTINKGLSSVQTNLICSQVLCTKLESCENIKKKFFFFIINYEMYFHCTFLSNMQTYA
jgi:hypothetical protein